MGKQNAFKIEEGEIISTKDQEFERELKPIFDSVLGLVQIATGGDPNQVHDLVKDPNLFFDKLVGDENGLLRGFIMARAMHEVVTRPSKKDPLDWAKLMLDVVAISKEKTVVIPERVEGRVVPPSERTTQDVIDQFIPRVEGPREPS